MAALIPFPFIIAGLASVFERADMLCFCFGTALGIVSWGLGQLFGYLLTKSENKGVLYLVRIGLWASCGALAFLAEAYLFCTAEEQRLSVMLTPAAVILWCWFGFRFGSKQQLMPTAMIGIYCAEAAVMYPITDSFEEKSRTGRIAILAITAVIIVCGVLLFNRRQLNSFSNMGKGRNRLISRTTLRFNTKTSLAFSGIILFMFFFAGYGARWLWDGVKTVIKFILYLLSRFSMEGEDSGGRELLPIDVSENTRIDTAPFWTIVVIATVILTVILLRKTIMTAIREFIEDFKKRFGKPASRTEEAQYIDVYRSTETGSFRTGTFKKAVRAFKREKEPTKKFRLGYKAFMIRIDEKAEKNTPSDTTRIHLEKGRKVTDFEKLEEVIDVYCNIRYGEGKAEEKDCEIMKKLIDNIGSTRKKV